ncbi:MAG: hypothetical protein KBS96_03085 [Lachnospiraceae bacterium]|nr:hypothetical protein [Candidatus Colinaster scatohippi]
MADFDIRKQIEGDIEAINKCSKAVSDIANEVRSTAGMLNWGASYSGILNRIKNAGNRIEIEGRNLHGYSEAGRTIIKAYFEAERRIINADINETVNFKASSNRSEADIDREIARLYRLINFLMNLFNIKEDTRKKFINYLEEYRQYLYDTNQIDIIVIPPYPEVIPEPAPAPEPEPAPQPEPAPAPEPVPQPEPAPAPAPAPAPQPKPQPVTNRDPNYSNTLFDDKGQYGARQTLPKNQDIYEVIRLFYPDWSDKQCKDLINRLGPEGCGYTVMANAVLWAYAGRADEFEAAYGISMYKNGDLNYDELVMYLYTMFDDANMEGIAPGYQGDYLISFMEDAGHTCTPEYFYETTPDQIPSDLNKGLLSFSTQGAFDITPVNGGKTMHFDEAHTMTVTGVAPDGRLIVSTWGGKYYIDPASCVGPYYTLFTFDIGGGA